MTGERCPQKRQQVRRQERAQRRCQLRRLVFEGLEERTLLATFAEAGSLLNLDMNVANSSVGIVSSGTSYSLTLTGDTWSGTDNSNATGNGTSTLIVTTLGLGVFDTINIVDATGIQNTKVIFNNSGANPYSDNFIVTLDDDIAVAVGEQSVVFSGSSTFGAFGLNVSTTRNIVLSSAASVSTSSGGITLQANTAPTPTTGNFAGITLVSANITSSGAGVIQLTGRGGTTSNSNYGVFLGGTGSHVTGGSSGTAVLIGGIGGSGSGQFNIGVYVSSAGKISAGGTGSVNVNGTGGSGSGQDTHGVYVVGINSQITSNGGAVHITGQGGGGAGSSLSMQTEDKSSGQQAT